MSPPLSPVDRLRAVPLTMINQFFTQTFWANGPAAKYGHQGIKLSNHMNMQPLKPVFFASRPSKREYEEVFVIMQNAHDMVVLGRSALSKHQDLRWNAVSDYLTSLTNRFVESRLMLRRLRHERETWTAADSETQGLVADMQNIDGEAMPHLANYRSAGSGHDLEAYLGQVDLLFGAASKAQLRLEREGRSLQHLLLEFVKQDDKTRADLATEHMGPLATRMRDVLRQTLEQTRSITSHHDELIREAQAVSIFFGHFCRFSIKHLPYILVPLHRWP